MVKMRSPLLIELTKLLFADDVQSPVSDAAEDCLHVSLYGGVRNLLVGLVGFRDYSLESQVFCSDLLNLGALSSKLFLELLDFDVLLPNTVLETRFCEAHVQDHLVRVGNCSLLHLELRFKLFGVCCHVCARCATSLELVIVELQLVILDAALSVYVSVYGRR
jgi:hypothetical protein